MTAAQSRAHSWVQPGQKARKSPKSLSRHGSIKVAADSSPTAQTLILDQTRTNLKEFVDRWTDTPVQFFPREPETGINVNNSGSGRQPEPPTAAAAASVAERPRWLRALQMDSFDQSSSTPARKKRAHRDDIEKMMDFSEASKRRNSLGLGSKVANVLATVACTKATNADVNRVHSFCDKKTTLLANRIRERHALMAKQLEECKFQHPKITKARTSELPLSATEDNDDVRPPWMNPSFQSAAPPTVMNNGTNSSAPSTSSLNLQAKSSIPIASLLNLPANTPTKVPDDITLIITSSTPPQKEQPATTTSTSSSPRKRSEDLTISKDKDTRVEILSIKNFVESKKSSSFGNLPKTEAESKTLPKKDKNPENGHTVLKPPTGNDTKMSIDTKDKTLEETVTESTSLSAGAQNNSTKMENASTKKAKENESMLTKNPAGDEKVIRAPPLSSSIEPEIHFGTGSNASKPRRKDGVAHGPAAALIAAGTSSPSIYTQNSRSDESNLTAQSYHKVCVPERIIPAVILRTAAEDIPLCNTMQYSLGSSTQDGFLKIPAPSSASAPQPKPENALILTRKKSRAPDPPNKPQDAHQMVEEKFGQISEARFLQTGGISRIRPTRHSMFTKPFVASNSSTLLSKEEADIYLEPKTRAISSPSAAGDASTLMLPSGFATLQRSTPRNSGISAGDGFSANTPLIGATGISRNSAIVSRPGEPTTMSPSNVGFASLARNKPCRNSAIFSKGPILPTSLQSRIGDLAKSIEKKTNRETDSFLRRHSTIFDTNKAVPENGSFVSKGMKSATDAYSSAGPDSGTRLMQHPVSSLPRDFSTTHRDMSSRLSGVEKSVPKFPQNSDSARVRTFRSLDQSASSSLSTQSRFSSTSSLPPSSPDSPGGSFKSGSLFSKNFWSKKKST
ncbi:unnamed protein product [Notodromas monacha]|uniref:Uncharacterized protein n=1 Tax=Notodromas monacha TaxID=399045 RepID=A0A7R9GB13_9CRUS|nr:unnamed protein product [Notodromas monacha]CAG0914318.1 unnamed protein product [Notodromas monacha]